MVQRKRSSLRKLFETYRHIKICELESVLETYLKFKLNNAPLFKLKKPGIDNDGQ